MKVGAEKSSSTHSAPVPQASARPFFSSSRGGGYFSPVSQTALPAVQMKLTVNKPGDRLEQEADRMADRIQRSPLPEEKIQKSALPESKVQEKDVEKVSRAGVPEEKLQRRGDGTPAIGASVQSAIQNKMSGGQQLPGDVRGYMEPRFGADFSNVRVHSDPESAGLSNQLGARAFAYRNHIFFSRDQFQPGTGEGRQLLAHELTHTVQQGHAVQRSPQASVTVTQPHIQRSVVGEILDWIADKANNLPGFRMFTVILGVNPINMSSVDRSASNILRALIEFIPGGALITTALDNHGVFNKIAAWVEKQIKALGMVGQMFKTALSQFIDSLGVSDLAPWNWGDVWNRAKRIFTAPIERLISFAVGLAKDILKFVKDAILKPLAALAQGTRGYDLLKALLGADPITGEPVPRTPDTLIGGFMKLIGQEDVWENIKKGNAVARAWAWFQGALSGLLAFARSIPRRIIDTISSLTFQDIITVSGAFGKIVGAFVNIAADFFSWALNQVISLLEILFSVVAPGAIPYIAKARAAFTTIVKNPVGFVGNLVRAGKLGFQMFADNILGHLKAALIKWLVGPLGDAGVYIPKSFDLLEIIKLVLSVLGLTWQNIRGKLSKIIPEPVLVGLEKTAGILVTLVKDGPAAAWEQIKAELSELKDQMIAQVTQMITTEVVKAAVMKLVSMLNPAGAVVQAIIATYNTITFFIQKINQIAAVVASFIDSIAAIAAGQIGNAAKKVEQTMANTLTVVIAFLAKFVGLGNVPEKLVGVIKKIRQPIDRGLDKIVAWLGSLLQKGKQAIAAVVQWWKTRIGFTNASGESHTLSFQGEDAMAVLTLESTPRPLVAYLADYETNAKPDAGKKELVKQIRAKVTRIENIKSKDGTRNRSSFGPEEGEAIRQLLTDIVALLAQLGDGGPPPPTAVTWTAKGEDGTSMIAEPLSINPGKFSGSQPSEESKLWQSVRTRYPGAYVRGHLLNHHVHGPGTKQNLTPITIGANNRMERRAESAIKKAALDERKILRYVVKVESFHGKKPGFADAEHLPAQLRMQAVEIVRKDGGWANVKTLVDESIASPLPS